MMGEEFFREAPHCQETDPWEYGFGHGYPPPPPPKATRRIARDQEKSPEPMMPITGPPGCCSRGSAALDEEPANKGIFMLFCMIIWDGAHDSPLFSLIAYDESCWEPLFARRAAASSHATTIISLVSCVKPTDSGTALKVAGCVGLEGKLRASLSLLLFAFFILGLSDCLLVLYLSVVPLGALTTFHDYVPNQNGLFSARFSDSPEEESRRRGPVHRHGFGSHNRYSPAGPDLQDECTLRNDRNLSDDL
ncbi:hypothetical protein INR49_029986 [Caranx melampygus]|nr:hypothetical protein INR49_029986 [Caranx melampygus]